MGSLLFEQTELISATEIWTLSSWTKSGFVDLRKANEPLSRIIGIHEQRFVDGQRKLRALCSDCSPPFICSPRRPGGLTCPFEVQSPVLFPIFSSCLTLAVLSCGLVKTL